MITDMMNYCNNHFLRSVESPELTFIDTSGTYTIEGELEDTYIVGQFVYISRTILNDGAYKITIVETNKLTVLEEVSNEVSSEASIFGCAVPRSFISLSSVIDAWIVLNESKAGISSEKIDDYSLAFNGKVSGGGGWQSAHAGQLAQYRAVFDDLERYFYYGNRRLLRCT